MDDFQLVTRKSKKKWSKSRNKKPKKDLKTKSEENIMIDIERCIEKLQNLRFYQTLLIQIDKV